MKKRVKILGTEYIIEKKAYSDDPDFEKRGIDGYCDWNTKKIVYCDMTTHPNTSDESKEFCDICENKTLKHEVIHAFFAESGLAESSACFGGGWATNEEMVDWMALQFDKIKAVYEELLCL